MTASQLGAALLGGAQALVGSLEELHGLARHYSASFSGSAYGLRADERDRVEAQFSGKIKLASSGADCLQALGEIGLIEERPDG